MYYTFQPLADLSNVHTGFWFIVALALVFALVIWPIAQTSIVAGLVGYSIIAFIVFVSYMSSWRDQPPRNDPVAATRVGFLAEGYNESQRHGKQHRRVDVHQLYVIYRLDSRPDVEVALRANPGSVYPEQVTLYGN